MAAGNFIPYSNAVLEMSKGSFDLATDTLVMPLVTTSYVPAMATDAQWSAASAYELPTGNGYTAGGMVLTGVTDTLTGNTVTFTCTSPSWASFSAGPFRYGLIVRRAGGTLASTDLLLCYSDLGGGTSITGTGGSFTISINASGIFTITHNLS